MFQFNLGIGSVPNLTTQQTIFTFIKEPPRKMFLRKQWPHLKNWKRSNQQSDFWLSFCPLRFSTHVYVLILQCVQDWSYEVRQIQIKLGLWSPSNDEMLCHLIETCSVWEVISHIRVMKFCVFYLVFLLVLSAHFTVLLFWQEDVYVWWVGPFFN